METERSTNEGLQGRKNTCDNPSPPQFDARPTMILPAVVACGYKRIRIPKSGNSFPAFLVAFEARNPSSSDEIGIPSFRGVRFAWRSKKDFLLLARKGGASQGQLFPKAALKKVVDETTVPWRRSSLPQSTAVGAVDPCSTCRKDNAIITAMEEGGHHRIFGDAIPDCLCNHNLPNRFSARMKKSIWQLDRFLQSMESKAEDNEPRQNAWEIFCRHSDTEDLVTPGEFFTYGISRSPKQNINTQDPEGQDANELPAGDVASTASAATNETIEATTTLRESSRLGQYFASKENSLKVVACALEKILPLYRRGDTGDDKTNRNTTRILFVEPSCGHGDIILSLIEALKEHEIRPDAVCIMGYDIDPGVIHTCRQRKEFRPRAASGNGIGIGDCYSDYPVLWECKSFFETSRENCIRDFETFFNNSNNNNHTGCTATYHDRDTQPGDQELLVCCLGGPPYTTGQGSGSAMKRDLPERFIDHCFTEWKADAISFLLPARYKERMKATLCDGALVTRPQTGTIATTAGTTDCKTKRWICETQELEASTFFFRGTTKVTQPSIIQIVYRSEKGELPSNL
jgi:hypothetical protein